MDFQTPSDLPAECGSAECEFGESDRNSPRLPDIIEFIVFCDGRSGQVSIISNFGVSCERIDIRSWNPSSKMRIKHSSNICCMMNLCQKVHWVLNFESHHRSTAQFVHFTFQMATYHVLREIGRGRMGVVYLAQSTSDSFQYFAVKEFEFESLDPQGREAARREVKIVQGLHHTNIVRIYDATMVDRKLHLLMEYADAGDLHDMIVQQAHLLPEDQILDIFTQICLAVKYIHDRKIIHRDLKTKNIFLCRDNIVKLGDFGFACTLASTTAQVTTAMGTPSYLSPEICMGYAYAAPSDIWALGCILVELCTRKICFTGSELLEIFGKILHGRIPRISSIYSPELRELAKFLLRKDPLNRPTINQILEKPILKFKALALLGPKVGILELSHSVFHGMPAGEMPEDLAKEIRTIDLALAVNDEFTFMGRPIRVGKCITPAEKSKAIRAFLLNLVDEGKIEELADMIHDNDMGLLPKEDESVADLISQLLDYEELHGLV
jgi:NIMA (never in mitosis gene a)-related kinase